MMNNNYDDKLIILFDGVCNMCVWSIQFIIKRDASDVFRFASLQSKEGENFIKKYNLNIDSIVLIQDGVVKRKSTAVLSILSHLCTVWRCLIIFYLIPYPIRDIIYDVIARGRYFLFGKRMKCMVPDEDINSKFISL